jgi:hypothetical protein
MCVALRILLPLISLSALIRLDPFLYLCNSSDFIFFLDFLQVFSNFVFDCGDEFIQIVKHRLDEIDKKKGKSSSPSKNVNKY